MDYQAELKYTGEHDGSAGLQTFSLIRSMPLLESYYKGNVNNNKGQIITKVKLIWTTSINIM